MPSTPPPCRDHAAEFFDVLEHGQSPFMDMRHVATRDAYCARCPVRVACFTKVMTEESGTWLTLRYGLNAGLTPGQRKAIEDRGSWRCPECSAPFDPLGFLAGELACSECDYIASVLPITENGEAWFDRHTKLGKRVVAWLIENAAVGEAVLSATDLAKELGARKNDVFQVYAALVYDGTLHRDGRRKYIRAGQTAALRIWRPRLVA